MPNYNFFCKSCNAEFVTFRRMSERHEAPCKCGKMAVQGVSSLKAGSVFDGHFEHITWDPVEARNKKELREICRRHGVYAVGALD